MAAREKISVKKNLASGEKEEERRRKKDRDMPGARRQVVSHQPVRHMKQ